MKRVLVAVVMVVLATITAAPSQTLHDEIALTRQEIPTERQAIVAANLQLSESESQAFWPLYRVYREDVNAQGDRLLKLLHDYAQSYDKLTDEQASALLDQWLSILGEENKIMHVLVINERPEKGETQRKEFHRLLQTRSGGATERIPYKIKRTTTIESYAVEEIQCGECL